MGVASGKLIIIGFLFSFEFIKLMALAGGIDL